MRMHLGAVPVVEEIVQPPLDIVDAAVCRATSWTHALRSKRYSGLFTSSKRLSQAVRRRLPQAMRSPINNTTLIGPTDDTAGALMGSTKRISIGSTKLGCGLSGAIGDPTAEGFV